jgi:multiple sugar transport system substrate-binding protein
MIRRRGFTVALVAVFVLALTAMCAQAQKLKVVVRTVPAEPTQEVLKAIPKKFKQATGYDVDIEFVASRELRRKLITAVETKTGPDIVEVLYNGALTVKDALEPVDDVVNEIGAKFGGYYDIFKQGGMFEGQWVASPYVLTSQILNYRKDILKKIGENPPDTWEDALRIGIKLKKAKLPVWAESLGSHVIDPSTTVLAILWSYGGRQISEDGKRITLDSPETRAALRFIKRAYEEAWPKAVIQWGVLENNQTFVGGKTAMTINANSIAWKLSTDKKWKNIYDNTGFVVTPRGPSGRHSTGIPQFLVLFKHSKMKKEGKAFLRFILDAKTQIEFAKDSWQYTPVHKGLEGQMPDTPYYKVMLEQAKYSRLPGWPGPPSPAAAEVHERFILVHMAQRVVRGQDIDASIKQAVAELRKIYKIQ